MEIKITNFDTDKVEEIKEAATSEWNFDDWFFYNPEDQIDLEISGLGEDWASNDEVKANWIAQSVLEVCDCYININASCLEDLPYESYFFEPSDRKKEDLPDE